MRGKISFGANPGRIRRLEGGLAALAGADADGLLDRGDEDLAVADLAGARRLQGDFDDLLRPVVGDHDLDLDFWQEIDNVGVAAILLRAAALPPIAAHVGDGHADDANGGKRLLDLVNFHRSDNALDLFHTNRKASQTQRD